MVWKGHPLTLGVLPSPNPPRRSKQAETWPDPRISPFWFCWPRVLDAPPRSRVRQLKVNSFRLVDQTRSRELLDGEGWLGSAGIEEGMKYHGTRLRRELFIAGWVASVLDLLVYWWTQEVKAKVGWFFLINWGWCVWGYQYLRYRRSEWCYVELDLGICGKCGKMGSSGWQTSWIYLCLRNWYW